MLRSRLLVLITGDVESENGRDMGISLSLFRLRACNGNEEVLITGENVDGENATTCSMCTCSGQHSATNDAVDVDIIVCFFMVLLCLASN